VKRERPRQGGGVAFWAWAIEGVDPAGAVAFTACSPLSQ